MKSLTDSEAHAQFGRVMDAAIHDATEVMVTRENGEAVVLVSLDTWNSINETLHVLASPRNAARLRAAIEQFESGSAQERGTFERQIKEPAGRI